MITLDQAKSLSTGTLLYSTRNFNRHGQPQRWKVTSVKTWKTRPSEVLIGLKHGLYAYDSITQNDLHLVALTEEEAKDERGATPSEAPISTAGNVVRGPHNDAYVVYSPANLAYILIVGSKIAKIDADQALVFSEYERITGTAAADQNSPSPKKGSRTRATRNAPQPQKEE